MTTSRFRCRGRMGRLVASETVATTKDLELVAGFDPAHAGTKVAGIVVFRRSHGRGRGRGVVVEFTVPGVVIENLAVWRAHGVHAVVGTSGFDEARIQAVRTAWGSGNPK